MNYYQKFRVVLCIFYVTEIRTVSRNNNSTIHCPNTHKHVPKQKHSCQKSEKWRRHFAWGEFILRAGEQELYQQITFHVLCTFIKLWSQSTSGLRSQTKHMQRASLSTFLTMSACQTNDDAGPLVGTPPVAGTTLQCHKATYNFIPILTVYKSKLNFMNLTRLCSDGRCIVHYPEADSNILTISQTSTG